MIIEVSKYMDLSTRIHYVHAHNTDGNDHMSK